MFRNIYIEAYKNSIQQNSTLEMMLIHANNIYAGLGCILQDIEFMVGNVLTHLKNNNVPNKPKPEPKERISMPSKLEKLQDITFKMPKYEFLPSSSLKYDQYDKRPYQPEQVRSNNIQNSSVKRNDSFQEMFPQRKKSNPIPNDTANSRNTKTPHQASTRVEVPPESQQDFIDYLFKKNKG